MTSYFDAKQHDAMYDASGYQPAAQFWQAIAQVEEHVIRDVSLVTGDREFPADLREHMQSVIACWAVCHTQGGLPPRAEAIQWVMTTGRSRLVDDLHQLFHKLASRRIVTRFGLLSDNPRDILKRRDAHDEDAARNQSHGNPAPMSPSRACKDVRYADVANNQIPCWPGYVQQQVVMHIDTGTLWACNYEVRSDDGDFDKPTLPGDWHEVERTERTVVEYPARTVTSSIPDSD